LQTQTYSRLKVAHIFPRAHDAEVSHLSRPNSHRLTLSLSLSLSQWISKGYPGEITDTADVGALGGTSKIDSLQNLITLRSDLRDAWDNYEFGVDPDVSSIVRCTPFLSFRICAQKDYHIVAFTNGNADLNGLHLQLDHIREPTQQPLCELFINHFMQGLLKHVKGSDEPVWTYEGREDAFDGGSVDLSKLDIWGTGEGKELFELALADRLLDHRVQSASQ
jgi:hypothetical protein